MLGRNMRFSTGLLLVLTPIGLAIGLHEAWRLAGGLVFLMAAQLLVLSLAVVWVVRTIRRESSRKESGKTPP
jgi:membrane protein implicated in regulation of membrane protease activity